MLNKIIIQGFQSHDDTNIDLNDITIFHGLSDSGKSAIRKALISVIHKNPFYMRDKDKKGSVCLMFDDFTIQRDVEESVSKTGERKTKSDVYKIDVPSEKFHKEYERFGTELPQEIVEKIKMPITKIGSKDVDFNVMNQFDDLFFIGESFNSIRDKMINMLVPDCDKAVKAVESLKEDKNSLTSDNRSMKKIAETKQCTLNKLSEIEKEKSLESLETIYSKLEDYENKIKDLVNMLVKLKDIKAEYERNKLLELDITKYKKTLEELKKEVSVMENLEKEMAELENIKRMNLTLVTFNFEQIKEKLSVFKNKVTNYNVLVDELEDLYKFNKSIKTMEIVMKQLDGEIDDIRRNRDELKQEIKQNNICIITGLPYKDECLKIIKNKH